jgi:hypothetical protein
MGPSIRTQANNTRSTPTIIMPEMANAVICPDTGKSLNHQEIITMLRYKFKLMRSTGNKNWQALQNQHNQIHLQV